MDDEQMRLLREAGMKAGKIYQLTSMLPDREVAEEQAATPPSEGEG